MKIFLSILFIVFLSGCIKTVGDFYKPNDEVVNRVNNKLENYELLKEGEEPQIIYSSEEGMDDNVAKFTAQGYEMLGGSEFVGEKDTEKNLIEQAKKVGATLVIAMDVSKGIQTNTWNFPQIATTSYYGSYDSGSAYTTYNVPMTYSYERVEQYVYFLVKNPKKFKFGLSIGNLTEKVKREAERNTGALVMVVFNDSPAFYSNVIRGDVIIKIDGIDIKSAADSAKVMEEVDTKSGSSVLTVIRKGKIKEVVVKFEN
jgi:competence protein ComGC